tara:strand:- start:8023 stop:8661 length:639 start_codon:yes stop_codon:yes gene_type:complete
MSTTDPLSDTLSDKIQHETYGLFPIPVTKYSVPNHSHLKEQILLWMNESKILEKHGREAICHNVAQIGNNNEVVNAIPELYRTIIDAVEKHNNNSIKYKSKFSINDSYLELASEGAIYAPHEVSNCLYSLCYFINYNPADHSFMKWRRNISSNHYPIIQIDSLELTPYNMTEATFEISEGDIVIFPSNLTHGYDTNPKNERITLTANITPSN